MPCSPRTWKYLHVACPNHTLQFQCLTFCLSNAGLYYSRMVEKMLAGNPESSMLRYFDDILIHTSGLEEYLSMLDRIFTKSIKSC